MSSTTGLKCGKCGGYSVELKTTDKWKCCRGHRETLFPVTLKVCLSCNWQLVHGKVEDVMQEQMCKKCGFQLQMHYFRE